MFPRLPLAGPSPRRITLPAKSNRETVELEAEGAEGPRRKRRGHEKRVLFSMKVMPVVPWCLAAGGAGRPYFYLCHYEARHPSRYVPPSLRPPGHPSVFSLHQSESIPDANRSRRPAGLLEASNLTRTHSSCRLGGRRGTTWQRLIRFIQQLHSRRCTLKIKVDLIKTLCSVH